MVEKQWAYTPAGGAYPPYLNVTELADGDFCVTVRSSINADGSCGATGTIIIDGGSFLLWLREIHDSLIQ